MERAMSALNRVVSSNAGINTILAGAFAVLAARSWVQDLTIEELQEEKDSLLTTNKRMKSRIWEWKQTLYAEAEVDPEMALVPLSTLKSIYGEAVSTNSAEMTGKRSIIQTKVHNLGYVMTDKAKVLSERN